MLRSKLLLATSFLLACLASFSQEKDGWQVYPAYTYPVQCVQTGSSLFVVTTAGELDTSKKPYVQTSNGNLVRYDLEDGSTRTYNCLDDLNGQHISLLAYNEEVDRVILIYDDNNIDILDPQNNSVDNVSALKDNTAVVNSVYASGKYFLLCTSIGVIEIDAASDVVDDTYRFDSQVRSMCLCNGYYYLATDNALIRIRYGANMHDQSACETVIPYKALSVCTLDNMVYTLCNNSNGVRVLQNIEVSGEKQTITTTGWWFARMCQGKDYVFIDGGSSIAYYKRGSKNLKVYQSAHNWINVVAGDSIDVWVIDSDNNILKYSINDDKGQLVATGDTVQFSLNCPKRDAAYSLEYDNENRLLVAGGVPPYTVYYIPETAMMMLPDGTWINFDENSQKTAYSYLTHRSLVSVAEDPEDDGHFYAAVSRNGLEEYRMDDQGVPTFQTLYNFDNSPLRIIKSVEHSKDSANYCSCYGLQYDRNGNLWMAQEMVDTIIRILRPDKSWLSLYYPEIKLADHPRCYIFPKSGPYFLINEKDQNCGILGFDINGTINYVEDDRHLLRSTITNQRGTSYSPKNFYCMTETNDGEIWVGTSEGLFVITDATQWFDEENFCFYQIIKNRDDGSGLADYVLDGVPVTAIAVDGANRKWIGTQSTGLYLLSDNGQETIYHFTKENSHLISDNIQSIAINPETGLVMIGTDKGLCSYNEGVTKPAETLKADDVIIYPNPVTPDNSSLVNITNLTDGAEVKILSSSGQVIWGGQSSGGRLTWDCVDMRGHHVDSGVYHVMINTKDAGKTITKRLVVVR